MKLRCPHCKAVILSRRNKICSDCHNRLPESFVFTPAELEKVEQEERRRQEQSRLRQERRMEAARRVIEAGQGGE